MINSDTKNSIIKHLDFILLDLICLICSFVLAYLIHFHGSTYYNHDTYNRIYLIVILTNVLYAVIANTYKDVLRRDFSYEIKNAIVTALVCLLSLTFIFYVLKIGSNYSRLFIAYTFIFYVIISSLATIYYKKYLKEKIKINGDKKNVLLVCEREDVNELINEIENSEFEEYIIKGLCVVDKKMIGRSIKKYKVICDLNNLYDSVVTNDISDVLIYCKPNYIDKDIVLNLINNGINYHISIDKIYDLSPNNESIDSISIFDTLNIHDFSFSTRQQFYLLFKRFADIILSLFALALLVPIYIGIKIASILSGDNEPIIYKQVRVGQNGKEFDLYKFRSMIPNADEVLKELLKDEKRKKEWKANQKLDNDPRITKVGHFIRKTSLDEFPQFINVLKGDMSIIGPRPLVPGELVEKSGTKLYHKIKPGITGWWACNGRSNITYNERLELEYYYIKNVSLSLDLMCIIKTIYVVLFRKGAK